MMDLARVVGAGRPMTSSWLNDTCGPCRGRCRRAWAWIDSGACPRYVIELRSVRDSFLRVSMCWVVWWTGDESSNGGETASSQGSIWESASPCARLRPLNSDLAFLQAITRLPPAVCLRKVLLRARLAHLSIIRPVSAASSEARAAGTSLTASVARVDPILSNLQGRRVQHRVRYCFRPQRPTTTNTVMARDRGC
jgi:hypothetical protein